MAFGALTHASAASVDSNAVTTGAIDTTGATLIVIMLGWQSGVASVLPTDNKANAWTPLTKPGTGAGHSFGRLFYCLNPVVGAGHTFSASSVGSAPGISVMSFSGLGIIIDQEAAAQGVDNAAQSTLAPGSLTPPQDNCLFVSGVTGYLSTGTVSSVDSGFTLDDSDTGVATGALTGIGHLIQGVAAAKNPLWTLSAAPNQMVAAQVTFKVLLPPSRTWEEWPNPRRRFVQRDRRFLQGRASLNLPFYYYVAPTFRIDPLRMVRVEAEYRIVRIT